MLAKARYGRGVAREPARRRPHPVAQHRQQLESLHSRLATACGQRPERIAEDMRTGPVLNAEEAVHYGLVGDVVAVSTSGTAPGQP